MITRLEQSNSQLYSNFIFSTRETLLQFAKASKENKETTLGTSPSTTHQSSLIVKLCVILIAIACITNSIHNIWFSNKDNQESTVQKQDDNYFSASDSIANDSIVVDSVAKFQR